MVDRKNVRKLAYSSQKIYFFQGLENEKKMKFCGYDVGGNQRLGLKNSPLFVTVMAGA